MIARDKRYIVYLSFVFGLIWAWIGYRAIGHHGHGEPESWYGPTCQLQRINLRFICQFLNLSKNRKETRGYQPIQEGF